MYDDNTERPRPILFGMDPEILKKKILEYESLVVIIFFVAVLVLSIFRAQSSINYPHFFYVKNGDTLSSIASNLDKSGFIKHQTIFKACAYLMGGSRGLNAGVYEFEKPLGACPLAFRIVKGNYSIHPIRTVFQEGIMKKEIVEKLKELPKFDAEKFLDTAKEGYLFPDTYFLNADMSEVEIIEIMKNNFDKKIATLETDIKKSKRTLKDIIIIASIVERETKFPEDRAKVAQVLWKRLDMKMPLQADATFAYINGKGTFELTEEDLKTNSPYNTYNRIGLPPTPIGNPGLESIKATISPSKTNYLYFLSDKAGHMYFANTFEGHQVNREKYLGK